MNSAAYTHQNRFLSTGDSRTVLPFSMTSSSNQDFKKLQNHAITETISFQSGPVQATTNPVIIRPVSRPSSSHQVHSGLVINHNSRTSSFSPQVIQGTHILNQRSSSPITTTTVGAPIPGPTFIHPPSLGSTISGPNISSRVIYGAPPSPTQINREFIIQNVIRPQIIKQQVTITNQKQINRLQTANQALIENYTNLYNKYKQLQNNSLKQQMKTIQIQSLNEVPLIRTIRGRIEQICDFELQTALSRLHSVTPKTNIFMKKSVHIG